MLGMVIGLVALFAVLPVIGVMLVVLSSVLFGSVCVLSEVFSGSGLLIGIVLGYLAVRAYRKNRIAETAE